MNVLPSGTIVKNKYKISSRLHQNDRECRAVYKALDLESRGFVVIKHYYGMEENDIIRFKQEYAILSAFHSKYFPHAWEYFIDNVNHFFVMDYIEGRTVKQIQEGDFKILEQDDRQKRIAQNYEPLPLEQVLVLADKILSILEFLHSHYPPILHRDIKPSNVIITSTEEVMLIDFGSAKMTGVDLTNSRNSRHYTPNFAAPEQFDNKEKNTPQTDLFQVAATMYLLLTGVNPESSEDRKVSRIRKNSKSSLTSIRHINPTVPRELALIIENALSLDHEDRPKSAQEMRQLLWEYAKKNRSRSNQTILVTLTIVFVIGAIFISIFIRNLGENRDDSIASLPTAIQSPRSVTPSSTTVAPSPTPPTIATGFSAEGVTLIPRQPLDNDLPIPTETVRSDSVSESTRVAIAQAAQETEIAFATQLALDTQATQFVAQTQTARSAPTPTIPTATATQAPTRIPPSPTPRLPTNTPQPPPPTATLGPPPLDIPGLAGTYGGTDPRGVFVRVTVTNDGGIDGVFFDYPDGVLGPELTGECAPEEATACLGYESTITQLSRAVRIQNDGSFARERIAVRWGDRTRYLSLSGRFNDDGTLTINILEENPVPSPSCIYRSSISATLSR